MPLLFADLTRSGVIVAPLMITRPTGYLNAVHG